MKKLTLLSFLLFVTLQTMAGDYDYLVIEKVDGTRYFIPSSGLVITFKDGKFYGTRKESKNTFTLSDLQRMYFSATSTGIESHGETADQATGYSLNGIKIGTFRHEKDIQNRLPKGIYIVKSNGKTYKQTVQ